MSANTSIEGNGKKELKVTKTNDAEKLIDKYFEEYIENADKYVDLTRNAEEDVKYVLSTHALTFKTRDENVKSQLGDDEEKDQNFVEAIDVLESGKQDFNKESIRDGAILGTKSAALDKVKRKADQIRKENAEERAEKAKKSTGDNRDR